MTHRAYTFGIFVAALLAWAAWGMVVAKLSPFSTPYLSLSLFYASFFLALMATFTLVNYYAKLTFRKKSPAYSPITSSIRQGFLLSTMLTLALFFQRLKVLTWWNGALLILIILLVEFYFGSDN